MLRLYCYITAAVLLIPGNPLFSQPLLSDTTIIFPVSGACEMCKERIEEAAKGKGVRSAVWDINTKKLTLLFNPAATTKTRVQKRIADAGHDSETEKARDGVYNELPACCHYRGLNPATHTNAEKSMDENTRYTGIIKGVVLEENQQGSFVPLAGASVIWLGTQSGTVTNASGVFAIRQTAASGRLIISFSGYQSDTVSITDSNELKIILASGRQLNEVRVTSRQRSTYLSSLNPIRTQVMTERELFKAACCNLSESFETNPSVDVSYNDAVTGSKQIQLLGLSGNYTQLTVENLPGPRGLATPLGLNFIAGPWVESIQLNKGVGSVANGFESIAGQINIELRKPEKAEKLYANVYINDMGKTDLNLVLAQKAGKRWSTALLLHDNFLSNRNVDFNKDGFRDMTTGNLFTAVNRWKFESEKGFQTQFGVKLLYDDRTGGETAFDPDKDRGTSRHYGIGISIKRLEAFAKTGYVFPEKKYKSIGLQLAAFDHKQDSYFGLTDYTARQKNFYANLIYQSLIGSTVHKFRTGISFQADQYDEMFNSIRFKRNEIIPGGFFEYTFTPVNQFGIVAGIRADHHNLFGWFATPRLHIRYEPVTGTTIRLSAGRGHRTANIFAENNSVFVSARQMSILSTSASKAYGLDPEIAWNKGISLDQKLRFFKRDASLGIDFFRNDFRDQVIVDLEDIRRVRFYNLDGKSFSNSLQVEMNMEPVRKLELRLAYRFFDVRTTYGGVLLQKPFTARHRAFSNLAYELRGWKFDYTFNYNGSKRTTGTTGNPPGYQRPLRSPSYVLMNAQVSRTVGKKHPIDLYIGAENLTNFIQRDPIISTDQPFGPYFDASLVWGPVSGRLLYAGFRFKIKQQ